MTDRETLRNTIAALMAEPMDPHIDNDRLTGYLNGTVEWGTLNSPEQAQIMDWRLR